jgi:hypothetical protein
MPVRSSAEFRSWGALRPGVDRAPARPLGADETVILRILPAPDERPAPLIEIVRLAGLTDCDEATFAAIERTLASLVAKGLAVKTQDRWRRAP